MKNYALVNNLPFWSYMSIKKRNKWPLLNIMNKGHFKTTLSVKVPVNLPTLSLSSQSQHPDQMVSQLSGAF
jgi:hypothetical protein